MVRFIASYGRELSEQGCSTSYSENPGSDRSQSTDVTATLHFELVIPECPRESTALKRRRSGLFAAIGLDIPNSGRSSHGTGKLVLGVSLPSAFHLCFLARMSDESRLAPHLDCKA